MDISRDALCQSRCICAGGVRDATDPRAKKNKRRGIENKDPQKAVFASSIARYVFKNGRRTVPPEQVLSMCGLLPDDKAGSAEVERLRMK